MTYWNKDKRALIDLVSFLFDRLDDDEAAARAQLTPVAIRQYAATDRPYATGARGGPARALRELAAKRVMVEMWFDGVQAEFCELPVAGLNVADAMIMALATVYADHPLFEPDWLADRGQPDLEAGGELDNVVELSPDVRRRSEDEGQDVPAAGGDVREQSGTSRVFGRRGDRG